MFSSSTQAGCWTYQSSKTLSKMREEVNQQFIAENYEGMTNEEIAKHFLTPTEERTLYRRYEFFLRDFCKKFQPPMPKNVIGCSFQYFKRFYLNNSVMDFHPKHIMVTCVFLACKVEEFNVSIAQFVANVNGDREKATEIILNNELLLMQQLNFDLTVHNPYRPVEGFLIDIKTRYAQIYDPERFRPAIDDFLDRIQLTDAFFMFSPSQIALAAVDYAASKCNENLESYLTDILLDGSPDKAAHMREIIKNTNLMIKHVDKPHKDQVNAIEMKLEKCRNEENNPSSLAYKRKLDEMQEEDEIEQTRKYSRITENEGRRIKEVEENLGIKVIHKGS